MAVMMLLPMTMTAQRLQQKLGRSVVAVNRSGSSIRSVTSAAGTGSLISWRKLAEEPEGTTYNVYKRAKGAADYTKVNSKPLTVTCLQTTLTNNTEYAVTAISPSGCFFRFFSLFELIFCRKDVSFSVKNPHIRAQGVLPSCHP